MENKFYNVSSVRLMRFLYALGFDKESYFNKDGKENWRFLITDGLLESIDFYHQMRSKKQIKIK